MSVSDYSDRCNLKEFYSNIIVYAVFCSYLIFEGRDAGVFYVIK